MFTIESVSIIRLFFVCLVFTFTSFQALAVVREGLLKNMFYTFTPSADEKILSFLERIESGDRRAKVLNLTDFTQANTIIPGNFTQIPDLKGGYLIN